MEEERKISKYSSGINIIIRLDSLWKDTHLHSRQGSYYKWNLDLDRIWLELARDCKEEDSNWEEKEKKFNSFDNEIASLGGFNDKIPEGFEKPDDDFLKKRDEIYHYLMEKQLFLARLENELGKGTTHYDSDEDDFD